MRGMLQKQLVVDVTFVTLVKLKLIQKNLKKKAFRKSSTSIKASDFLPTDLLKLNSKMNVF